jgi:membrane protease subunit HflC
MHRNDTRLLLKPDSDFFRYFVNPSGAGRDTAPAAGSTGPATSGPATQAPATRAQ